MRSATSIVLLFVVTTIAQAQESARTAMDEGKQRFHQGTKLYDLGRFAEAALEYEAAFRLTERAALLFNLGQAYRLAGEAKKAIAAYDGYLRREPLAPQRAEVESHIVTLQRKIEDDEIRERNKHSKHSGERETEFRPGRTKKIAGLVVGVIGVAAIGAGIGTGVLAKQAGDDLSAINSARGQFDKSKEDFGVVNEAVSGAMLGIGAAAIVIGAIVGAVGLREERARKATRASVRPVFSPTGGGAVFTVGL